MDLYHNKAIRFKLSRQQKVGEVQQKLTASKFDRAATYQTLKGNTICNAYALGSISDIYFSSFL